VSSRHRRRPFHSTVARASWRVPLEQATRHVMHVFGKRDLLIHVLTTICGQHHADEHIRKGHSTKRSVPHSVPSVSGRVAGAPGPLTLGGTSRARSHTACDHKVYLCRAVRYSRCVKMKGDMMHRA